MRTKRPEIGNRGNMPSSLRENRNGEHTFFLPPFIDLFSHYDSQIGGEHVVTKSHPTHTHTNKLPESRIVEIVSSAVEIEMEFVIDALPVELIGMNSGMMCNYIRFCADQLLLSLGCGRHYKIGNPLEWMETISLQGKTNFSEK